MKRLRAAASGDEGSAVVEFATIGVLLMVPLVYLVVTMGRLQAASYAVDAAARGAGRAYVSADTAEEGDARAVTAVRFALDDQGFDDVDPRSALDLDCSAAACLTPGERVVARVSVKVPLPGMPGFLGDALPLDVTVRSTETAVVDRFRAQP